MSRHVVIVVALPLVFLLLHGVVSHRDRDKHVSVDFRKLLIGVVSHLDQNKDTSVGFQKFQRRESSHLRAAPDDYDSDMAPPQPLLGKIVGKEAPDMEIMFRADPDELSTLATDSALVILFYTDTEKCKAVLADAVEWVYTTLKPAESKARFLTVRIPGASTKYDKENDDQSKSLKYDESKSLISLIPEAPVGQPEPIDGFAMPPVEYGVEDVPHVLIIKQGGEVVWSGGLSTAAGPDAEGDEDEDEDGDEEGGEEGDEDGDEEGDEDADSRHEQRARAHSEQSDLKRSE